MIIKIHRGQNQIGGSIIEIASERAKIILDTGVELDEMDDPQVPQIDGLFVGDPQYNAVFLSHYHADHIGLADKIVPEIPIYMGEKAFEIISASNEYRKIDTKFSQNFLRNVEPITVGDMKITPYSCDHSAFDSYMLLIECDGKTALYTGDFRANGRGEFEELLKQLPKVDAVIIEGTTLSREYTKRNIEEEKLEEIGVDFLAKHNGPAFIYCASTNVDRLITAHNIAKRTGRIFLEDIYTARIAARSGVAEIAPKRGETYVFQTDGSDRQHAFLQEFNSAKIGKESIAKKNFLMTVRPSMKNYIKKLNELRSFDDGVLFYALWSGYKEQPATAEFLEFMEQKGVKLHTLHTSGHADSQSIEELISKISPGIIVPVHTENADYYNKFSGDCRIVLDTDIIEV